MGMAEAIAMIMIVTANSFAMSSHLTNEEYLLGGKNRWTESIGADPAVTQTLLLGLVREVCRSRAACSHGHLLCLGSVGFLPGRHGVVAGRHILNSVVPAVIGNCVGSLNHHMVAVHPGMDIALHRDRDFLRLPALDDRRRSGRL